MTTRQASDTAHRNSDATISSNVPASVYVYESLRGKIIALDLPPGERLSRADLAEQYGVSASPLREALQRLEIDGLIATFRQSRTEVTHIDAESLRREHFLRTAIECEVVRTLAETPDEAALKKAGAILKLQQVLIDDPEQIDMFRKLDEDFHRELFAGAGQLALHASVTERSSQMARLRSIDLPSEGKSASVVKGHQAVLEAIASGDSHKATDAMRTHLSGTIRRLPEIMAQHPDYFRSGGSDEG